MTDDSAELAVEIDRSKLEYVKTQHWRYEGTDYVLGYIPSECNKCGDEGSFSRSERCLCLEFVEGCKRKRSEH